MTLLQLVAKLPAGKMRTQVMRTLLDAEERDDIQLCNIPIDKLDGTAIDKLLRIRGIGKKAFHAIHYEAIKQGIAMPTLHEAMIVTHKHTPKRSTIKFSEAGAMRAECKLCRKEIVGGWRQLDKKTENDSN